MKSDIKFILTSISAAFIVCAAVFAGIGKVLGIF